MHCLTQAEINDFLSKNSVNLHDLSLEQFRGWLSTRIKETSKSEVFQLRCEIRDLKRTHRRRLRDRERRLSDAQRAYEKTEASKQIRQLTKESESLNKAVEGLTLAVSEGRAEKKKLKSFREKLHQVTERMTSLSSSVPEKKRFDRAIASMRKLREEIGLDEAESNLQDVASQKGHSSVRAGTRFEEISSQATTSLIVPQVTSPTEKATVLHGVTLGCARGELDQLVVVNSKDSEVVEVRALVEAKRNINDLVHGFRQRQENLAWFVGDSSGYDAELYRTDRYKSGDFDGVATHQEEYRDFHFDSTSFQRFDTNAQNEHRLDGLFFVTEKRRLLGTTTAELGRILHRVATDPSFRIESDTILRRFRKWTLDVVGEFQTQDVLRLYSESEKLSQHLIFA